MMLWTSRRLDAVDGPELARAFFTFSALFEPLRYRLLSLGTDMRRREFIRLLGGAAVAWPLAARAQQPERIRRVGVLTPKPDLVDRNDVAAFTNEFQRLGWEEGRNFHLEYRAVSPNEDELRSAAADLVGLKPEVILVVSSPVLRVVQASTDTIPIVFVGVIDPVDAGFVANLAHPGGNITGFASFEYSIASKWLQLLKEISPRLRHFAVIFDPNTTPGGWFPVIKGAAPAFGLEVNEAAVNDDDNIDGVLGALKTSSDAGVIVLPSSFTMLHHQRIIDFAARYQLPAVYWDSRFVKDGGLMSYAFSLDEEERQGATYVDRILKGEKPGDLPVQETTKFELVINLKTAKALGITMPASLLAVANEVIE
jgi:putative tryptophan/tyrosine transport system substrate-binding protein